MFIYRHAVAPSKSPPVGETFPTLKPPFINKRKRFDFLINQKSPLPGEIIHDIICFLKEFMRAAPFRGG